MSSESNTDRCPVCLEGFSSEINECMPPCGHRFHFTCFMRAFENSHECALCRADVFPERSVDPERTRIPNNDDDDDEDDIVEFSLEDLGEDTVETIRNHIRDQLNAQLLNSTELGSLSLGNISNVGNLFKACEEGSISGVSNILSRDSELKNSRDVHLNTILHSAIISQNENMVRYLINEIHLPTDCTNVHRMTPIHYAIMSKSIRMVRLLINCGAFIDPQDNSGKTPLMMACQIGDSNICQLLLDNNASVNLFDMSGSTALHFASSGRSVSCVRNIIGNEKTNQNAVDFFNNTPLHLACINGSTTIVRILLASCANSRLENKAGHKPIDLVSSDNSRLRSLVREYSS